MSKKQQILKSDLVAPPSDPGSNPAGLRKKNIFSNTFFHIFFVLLPKTQSGHLVANLEKVSRPSKEANLTITQNYHVF